MAISTPTLLGSGTVNGNSGTVSTGTISPSANALLIAVATRNGSSDTGDFDYNTVGVGDTFTGTGTWTAHERLTQTPAIASRVEVFTAQAGSSPGSGTVTAGYATASANTRWVIHVVEIASGFDTTTPIKQSKSVGDAGAGASTYSVTLDSTPDSDSCQIGFISVEDDTNQAITEGSGYTELAESNSGGSHDATLQVQYDLTAPSDGVSDWSDTTGDQMIAATIEVDDAGGGPAGRTTKNTDSHPLGIHAGISRRINAP